MIFSFRNNLLPALALALSSCVPEGGVSKVAVPDPIEFSVSNSKGELLKAGSLKVTCLENDVIGDGESTVKISQEADSNEVLSVDVTCQDNDSANINLSKIDDSSNVLEASQG